MCILCAGMFMNNRLLKKISIKINLPQPPSQHLVFWGLWKIVAYCQLYLAVPSCITFFGTVSSLHPTSLFNANEVGCRDNTMQKTVDTRRHRRQDCCMLSILPVVPSCIYSFWRGVFLKSYFIFRHVHAIPT